MAFATFADNDKSDFLQNRKNNALHNSPDNKNYIDIDMIQTNM